MYIALLCGGRGLEREVSLASGKRVTEALISKGHRIASFDFDGTLTDEQLPVLKSADAVFLALHGDSGEGGDLQKALDTAGIRHYTGSSCKGAALAMNKRTAKQVVHAAGLPVASDALWLPNNAPPSIPFPFVAKPLCGGSSIGLCVVKSSAEMPRAPTEPLLLESLLVGREYTVGILGKSALPVVEIRVGDGLYDYRHKYTPGEAEELCPAPLSPQKAFLLQSLARQAFAALELRDFARVDFKEDAAGTPHFLEANTLPGMTATSLLPLAAAAAGIHFPSLCEKMALLAAARKCHN